MSQKNINNKKTVQRLIKNYILPYKFNILFALTMMIVSASATGLHAWLVRPALDDVLISGDKQMLLLIPIAIIITTEIPIRLNTIRITIAIRVTPIWTNGIFTKTVIMRITRISA